MRRDGQEPAPRRPDLPGRSVLGFLACAAVVRRCALLAIDGFPSGFGVGGEEELVALDLAAAGWGLAYVDAVMAHHHPVRCEHPGTRERVLIRNGLWTAWSRRRLTGAARTTCELATRALRTGSSRALLDATRGLPRGLRQRRPVPRSVEQAARALEGDASPATPRRRPALTLFGRLGGSPAG